MIKRVWAYPNKNTFDIKPIKELIEKYYHINSIDPFANKNKFASTTNDLDSAYNTDYHLDALDFLKIFQDNSINLVLWDPPYSPRQVSECWRLMGFSDEEFQKAVDAGVSNSQLYKQAGNSIVTFVLAYIFKNLLTEELTHEHSDNV